MEQQTRLTYLPGTVTWKSNHGSIFLYQANTQNPDNITMSVAALSQAKLAPGAGVFYNKERIGTVISINFEVQRKSLTATIRLDIKTAGALPDPDYLLAVPELDTLGISCPLCLQTFALNSQPCACIYRSPVLVTEKVRVISVSVYDIRHNNRQILDGRQELLRRYFSGAVGTLLLMEPL